MATPNMEANEAILLDRALTTVEQGRASLLSRTNSPPTTPTRSSSRRVRRRTSFKCSIVSSEDFPSSHESIYNAEYFSSFGSEDCSQKLETCIGVISPRSSSSPPKANDENALQQLLSPAVGNTPIIYGHGTALATIVEQKSTNTICTKAAITHSKFVPDLSIRRVPPLNLLGHRDSFDLPSTVTLRSPRRSKSFSADDLAFIKRSYHEACIMIDCKTRFPFEVHKIYAEPRTPLVPPIERPATPPGMPSWTEAQNAPIQGGFQQQNRAVRGTKNRLQRFLGLEAGSTNFPYRVPIPSTPRQGNDSHLQSGAARSLSSPIPFRNAPRFRPPKSGHGGPLETHPFLRAETIDTKSENLPAIPRILSLQPGIKSRSATVGERELGRRRRLPSLVRQSEHRNPAQCPHRRGRLAILRALKTPIEPTVPNTYRSIADLSLPSASNSQVPDTQQDLPISLNPIIPPRTKSRLQVYTLANEFPPSPASDNLPMMSGAVASSASPPPAVPSTTLFNANTLRTNNTSTLRTSHPTVATRCWKCSLSHVVDKIDGIWEASTSWCCWIFCGVDLDECDVDFDDLAGMNIGPRRVLLDGVPVIVF